VSCEAEGSQPIKRYTEALKYVHFADYYLLMPFSFGGLEQGDEPKLRNMETYILKPIDSLAQSYNACDGANGNGISVLPAKF